MLPSLFLVDDERLIGHFLSSHFQNQFKVTYFQDSLEAINHIREGNFPTAIILDLQMPSMGGMEFLTELRQMEKANDVIVIMLSSVDESPVKIKALLAGADDYVTKPFNPEEIELRLGNILRRRIPA